jgi:Uma2 family endonuclease
MTSMPAQMTDAPVPLGEYVPNADERVVMYGISWEGYETLLALRGERHSPRMAYLDGAIELMSPSREHEDIKSRLEALINAFCVDTDRTVFPCGGPTLRARLDEVGLEPDASFTFDERKGVPDLALEVVWTSGGIEKLEIYRRLGVREVWFWKRDDLAIFVLENDRYVLRTRSHSLPELDAALVCRLAVASSSLNDAVRELRAMPKQ